MLCMRASFCGVMTWTTRHHALSDPVRSTTGLSCIACSCHVHQECQGLQELIGFHLQRHTQGCAHCLSGCCSFVPWTVMHSARRHGRMGCKQGDVDMRSSLAIRAGAMHVLCHASKRDYYSDADTKFAWRQRCTCPVLACSCRYSCECCPDGRNVSSVLRKSCIMTGREASTNSSSALSLHAQGVKSVLPWAIMPIKQRSLGNVERLQRSGSAMHDGFTSSEPACRLSHPISEHPDAASSSSVNKRKYC